MMTFLLRMLLWLQTFWLIDCDDILNTLIRVGSDHLVWHFANNRKYLVKFGYKIAQFWIFVNSGVVQAKFVVSTLSMITPYLLVNFWYLKLSCKLKYFIWLCLNEYLYLFQSFEKMYVSFLGVGLFFTYHLNVVEL